MKSRTMTGSSWRRDSISKKVLGFVVSLFIGNQVNNETGDKSRKILERDF